MPVKRRVDNGAWEVTIPRPGRAPLRRSSAKWSRADAIVYEAEHIQPQHLLTDALDKWLAEYVPYLSGPKKYESVAAQLKPLLAGKTFDDVPNIVSDARRRWGRLKPATINRRLAALRRITRLAYKEWRWIKQPVHTYISLLKENNERHYYLTREQVERLALNCTRKDAGQVIVLAAFTGLRWSECLSLTVDMLHDDHLPIRVKGNKWRYLPLHPRALNIIQQMPFEGLTPAVMRKQFNAARIKCNLKHIHFHDLRHTWASWLVKKHVSLKHVQDLMNHADIKTTMRYAHLATDDLVAAIGRVE